MKAGSSTGLIVAGGLQRMFLSGMPTLLEQLGPVKAASYQVARRAVNSLRSGYAISHYSALERCSLIWIAVPEITLDRVVFDLAAQMPVHRTMIVLCDMQRDSSWPNALRTAGARMASVNVVGEGRNSVLIGEGHHNTLRVVRRLFAREGSRFLEVLPAAKGVCFAGIHFSTQLLLPWIDASTSCLRAAGLTRAEATELTMSLSARIVRSYASAGRKAWNQDSAAGLRRSLERDAGELESIAPRLAALYAEGIRLALAHFAARNVPA